MEKNFFFQCCNPTTGELEWKAESEDEYDYFKDIARSSYADMLHDKERNALYYKAIKLAVQQVHAQGKIAKVLDIGTGTGLLSMMAATAGAEVINAIEVFAPMAKVARRIVKGNGFPHINIINKHSTEVIFGEDIKEKCNIIITELFDTELIGEGALRSYQHAHEHFMQQVPHLLLYSKRAFSVSACRLDQLKADKVQELVHFKMGKDDVTTDYFTCVRQFSFNELVEDDCLAVPHRAMVYAQVVESDLMKSWNELSMISSKLEDGSEIRVEADEEMSKGIGLSTVHDIQLSQITTQQFHPVSHPCQIFEFDWSSSKLCTNSKMDCFKLKSIRDGVAQIVLSWWDLEMFKDSNIILSTAPKWLHPTPNDMQWRDHWIQSIYYLPIKVKVEKDGEFMLKAFHDDYTMWFEAYDVCEMEKATSDETIILPLCSYPPRALLSRPRMGMLNDAERNRKISQAIAGIIPSSPSSSALCISDFSLISLLLAQNNQFKGRVVAHERSKIAQRGLYNMARHNKISDERLEIVYAETITALKAVIGNCKFDMLIAEPFFTSSQLPWHDLYFWYARTRLQDHLAPDVRVMPRAAHLCLVAVSLKDLYKIRAPVGKVEGFDVSLMDDMINKALDKEEDHRAEPQHLWEYPNKLVSSPVRVMKFDFTQCVPADKISCEGQVEFSMKPSSSSSLVDDFTASHCHGFALWMEYELDASNEVSTGLLSTSPPVWCKHHKQAVYFLKHPFKLPASDVASFTYHVQFSPASGDVITRFHVD